MYLFTEKTTNSRKSLLTHSFLHVHDDKAEYMRKIICTGVIIIANHGTVMSKRYRYNLNDLAL